MASITDKLFETERQLQGMVKASGDIVPVPGERSDIVSHLDYIIQLLGTMVTKETYDAGKKKMAAGYNAIQDRVEAINWLLSSGEISGDVDVEPLTVSENGEYMPGAGKAYGRIVVDTPIDMAPKIIEGTLSEYSSSEVKSIKENFFSNYSPLTSVSFPACTHIGSKAFAGCSSLTSISFPACTNIYYSAFYSCSSLTSVSFPACTSIGTGAFAYCSSLTSVSFPACTVIGEDAFFNCSSLTSASFPVCAKISGSAFYSCSSLTSVSFPACTSIGGSAFSKCTSLTDVSFPVCTNIGSSAFCSCYSLASISFPACTNISSNAFCIVSGMYSYRR